MKDQDSETNKEAPNEDVTTDANRRSVSYASEPHVRSIRMVASFKGKETGRQRGTLQSRLILQHYTWNQMPLQSYNDSNCLKSCMRLNLISNVTRYLSIRWEENHREKTSENNQSSVLELP